MLLFSVTPYITLDTNVLSHANKWFPVLGAKVVASQRIDHFNDVFKENKFVNDEVKNTFDSNIALFKQALLGSAPQ